MSELRSNTDEICSMVAKLKDFVDVFNRSMVQRYTGSLNIKFLFGLFGDVTLSTTTRVKEKENS